MLRHRKNVRPSKFWRKSKEKKRIFFRKFTKGIQGFDLGKKNSKLSHACVPLKVKIYFLHIAVDEQRRPLQADQTWPDGSFNCEI